MTVDEMISFLKEVSNDGKGGYDVVDSDTGNIITSPMIWDDEKTVSI